MKTLRFPAITLLILLSGVAFADTPPATAAIWSNLGLTPLPNRPIAPALNLSDPRTGKTSDLASFKGRWVLLNFWATWCGPCLEEFPSLEHLSQLIPEGQLKVLAVSSSEQSTVVKDFLKENPHAVTVLADIDGKVSAQFGIRALPTTYLIDPQGRVVAGKSGALYWDTPNVVQGLKELVK